MPGFRVRATLVKEPGFFARLLRWLLSLCGYKGGYSMQAFFDFIKNTLGQRLIATVLSGLLTTWLVTWNAAHNNIIPQDTVVALVGVIVASLLAFLGFHTVAQQAASAAESSKAIQTAQSATIDLQSAQLSASVPTQVHEAVLQGASDGHQAAVKALAESAPAGKVIG